MQELGSTDAFASGRAAAFTEALSAHCVELQDSILPEPVLRMAEHCLLDWAAVSVAGAEEPLAEILVEVALEEVSGSACTLVGRFGRATELQATLVNGAVGHALDFDDVNSRMHGHPTVTIAPAVLAVAERENSTGIDVLRAFVGGYQIAGRLGAALGLTHYGRGFHATATVGAIAAAAGVAILLRLNSAQTEASFGIAASLASGLKANFGTMTKPLHAGRAAQNGVMAARLAQKGFTAREGVFQHPQGMGAAMSDSFDPDASEADAPAWEIESNLFKYHAACYLTHSSIEALRRLREREGLDPSEIAAVELHIPEGHRKVCDVREPRTGLDVKFSIRHLAALALHGADTAVLGLYTDATAQEPNLVRLREKVTLAHEGTDSFRYEARAVVTLVDGRSFVARHDVGQPQSDLGVQENALREKAATLVDPVLGPEAGARLFAAVSSLKSAGTVANLMQATVRS